MIDNTNSESTQSCPCLKLKGPPALEVAGAPILPKFMP